MMSFYLFLVGAAQVVAVFERLNPINTSDGLVVTTGSSIFSACLDNTG